MQNNDPRFWSEPASGDWWLEQDGKYKKAGDNQISEDYLRANTPTEAKRILEVGAGTGRLIGLYRKREKHSVDVNPRLCQVAKERHPSVIVHNCSAHRIDLPDDWIDLTFTHQVLQHVPNDWLRPTLEEFLRVTKDRLWLMEGWKPNKEQGENTHKSNGGSYVYYFDKILKCEAVEWLIPDKIKIYKIRKADNPMVPSIPFGEFV